MGEEEAGSRLFQVLHDPKCTKSGVNLGWVAGLGSLVTFGKVTKSECSRLEMVGRILTVVLKYLWLYRTKNDETGNWAS